MKAIRLHTPGDKHALSYEDMPTPEPKAHEVLIQIEAIGVNYIDTYIRSGFYPRPLPLTLGMEAAGIVVAVGQSVTTVRIGERVASVEVLGAYAEYAVVSADKVVVLPSSITTHQAAAVLLQGLTAYYLSRITYPLHSGDTCLVHAAAGGVGLLLCQMAKQAGARVIGTVSTPEKAELAKKAGADDVILYTHQDFEQETRRLTQGQGVQVVYDSVGKTTFNQSLNVLSPLGMMVSYGQSSGSVGSFDPLLLTEKGSLFFTRPKLFDYIQQPETLRCYAAEIFRLIEQNHLYVHIGAEFCLSSAAKAHEVLEGRQTTGKILLIPE